MKTRRTVGMLVALVVVAPAVPCGAAGSPDRIRWQRIDGIVEPANPVGSGTGQVGGAGQPFSVDRGTAELDRETGRLRSRVRGLSFAGGNAIGTTGTFAAMKGVLVCDTNSSASGGNSVRVETPESPLNAAGEVEFDGTVTLDPVCLSEPDLAFLVVNPAGMWVAHGAQRSP
jgi:hypothetical protein